MKSSPFMALKEKGLEISPTHGSALTPTGINASAAALRSKERLFMG